MELDQAKMLRDAAIAKKQKSASRVTAATRLAVVIAFLNNDGLQFEAVEDTYAAGTKHTQIVAGFRSVIVENKLDELVYPIISDGHVFLVKLVDTTPVDDENEDDDQ